MVEEVHRQYLKGWRAEVGMLAPVAGMYREYEVLAPEGVRFSRAILGLEEVTPESLKILSDQIEVQAKRLNIGHKMDLICLAITSGSFIGGPGYDQQLIKMIEDATGVPATTTTTSLLVLFRDMNIKKLAMVGPYIKEVFDAEVDFFKAAGIETLTVQWLGYNKTEEFWDYRHNPYAVYKLIKEGNKAAPNADCVFVTCMWSSIMGIVDMAEQEIGKPIISSCSAVMYNILKMLKIPDPVYHYGEALRRPRL